MIMIDIITNQNKANHSFSNSNTEKDDSDWEVKLSTKPFLWLRG